jgi:hypothetical protein
MVSPWVAGALKGLEKGFAQRELQKQKDVKNALALRTLQQNALKNKFSNALAAARIKKITKEAGDTSAKKLREAKIKKYETETKNLETAQTINDNYFKSKVDALKQNIVDKGKVDLKIQADASKGIYGPEAITFETPKAGSPMQRIGEIKKDVDDKISTDWKKFKLPPTLENQRLASVLNPKEFAKKVLLKDPTLEGRPEWSKGFGTPLYPFLREAMEKLGEPLTQRPSTKAIKYALELQTKHSAAKEKAKYTALTDVTLDRFKQQIIDKDTTEINQFAKSEGLTFKEASKRYYYNKYGKSPIKYVLNEKNSQIYKVDMTDPENPKVDRLPIGSAQRKIYEQYKGKVPIPKGMKIGPETPPDKLSVEKQTNAIRARLKNANIYTQGAFRSLTSQARPRFVGLPGIANWFKSKIGGIVYENLRDPKADTFDQSIKSWNREYAKFMTDRMRNLKGGERSAGEASQKRYLKDMESILGNKLMSMSEMGAKIEVIRKHLVGMYLADQKVLKGQFTAQYPSSRIEQAQRSQEVLPKLIRLLGDPKSMPKNKGNVFSQILGISKEVRDRYGSKTIGVNKKTLDMLKKNIKKNPNAKIGIGADGKPFIFQEGGKEK